MFLRAVTKSLEYEPQTWFRVKLKYYINIFPLQWFASFAYHLHRQNAAKLFPFDCVKVLIIVSYLLNSLLN